MGVVGINSIDVGADATALAGPGEPPLGNLMPFVAQNPLGPFVPGDQYQIRSEDEGECGTASLDQHLADLAGASGCRIGLLRPAEDAGQPVRGCPAVGSGRGSRPARPSRPRSIVTLTAENGAKIHYTTDGSTPTAASAQYSGPLTFTATTTLKAIAKKGSAGQRDRHLQLHAGHAARARSPRRLVTARSSPARQSVTLSTTTAGSIIYYTTNGTDPTTSSAVYEERSTSPRARRSARWRGRAASAAG